MTDTTKDSTQDKTNAKTSGYLWNLLTARFRTGSFLRNVTIVASGSMIAQMLLILTSPILTRLYSPANFGILAVYNSFVPILTILATFEYHLAIVLPKRDKDAKVLLGVVIRTAVVVIFFVAIFVFIIILIGLNRVGFQDIPWIVLPMIIISVFIHVLIETFNYWNIRTKSFTIVSTAVVSAAIATVLIKIGLGWASAGWWGLIIGSMAGMITNFLVQLFHGNRLKVIKDSLVESSDKKYKREVLSEYSDFPKFRLPQDLLNSCSRNLPAVMLVTFFDPTIGGFYALAYRIIKLPGTLVSGAIRKVFYQKAADLSNRGIALLHVTLKATLGLAAVGIIPFGSIVIFGPSIFSIIFGEEWRTAGIYASWGAMWIFFLFCNGPSVSAIPVLLLQKQFLVFEIVSIVARLSAIGAGVIVDKPIVSIIAYSICGAAANIVLITAVHIKMFHDRHRPSPVRGAVINE